MQIKLFFNGLMLAALCVQLLSPLSAEEQALAGSRPNIILVMTDDQAWVICPVWGTRSYVRHTSTGFISNPLALPISMLARLAHQRGPR